MQLDKALKKLQEQLVPKIDSALSKEVLQAVSDAEGKTISRVSRVVAPLVVAVVVMWKSISLTLMSIVMR